jgi:carbon storage regulator
VLILSRRVGETICIGDGIEVKVVTIRRGQVQLGFTGPPEVPIHREEVYQQIKANDEKAEVHVLAR